MNESEIPNLVRTSEEYHFLMENEHLGNNLILLGLGGSYAYGTNVEGSDIDLRGCALNTKKELLTGRNFNQIVDANTDTTIYSFNKLLSLLLNCNPNTIELLGLRPKHYLYVSSIGKELLDNAHLFLSQKAAQSFGGYAYSQLRRLDNKAVRLVGQEERENHILHSIENAADTFPEKYFPYNGDSIKLYVDKSEREEYDSEIFMDINLQHYPLRDYKCMWSEMQNIVKDYSKIGKRNKYAIEHDKLGKHMMHLVRLYFMCIDILTKEQIITYREEEHDLLMSIRNGEYLDSNQQPTSEFYEMLEDLQQEMNYAKIHTSLPEKPDYKAIEEFQESVNSFCVL